MSKKNKIILIILSILILIIASGVIIFSVLKFNSNKQLKTPSQPQVFQSTDLIVIETSQVDGATKYMFEITTPNSDKYSFENSTNILTLDFAGETSSLKSNFDYAGIYTVQCYAVAENANNNSYKTNPTNFERTLSLLAPEISRKNGAFVWEKIKNADYYEIQISSNEATYTKVLQATETLEGIESITLANLIQEFELQPNQYSISIRACSENKYYITSYYSNTILFIID